MAAVTRDVIVEALRAVPDPDRGDDIVTLGMVSGIVSKDGNVGFTIEVEPERGPLLEPLRKAAEQAVRRIPGVLSVTAVLTAHAATGSPAPRPRPQSPPRQAERSLAPGVRSIVAVASGKGGVGKSTTAVNLALALAGSGLRTGILDADIYGPSLPRMMGISEKPTMEDGRTLQPLQRFGVKCMSIGFMVPEDSPTIWRGPMVMSALEQMFA